MKSGANAVVVFSVFAAALLCAACGSGGAAIRPASPKYRDSEASFDPSKYRDHRDSTRNAPLLRSGEVTSALPGRMEKTERLMGFRVQVFSTTNLDEALTRRDSLMRQLQSDTIEIVFDAPYYKLRTGNFTERKAAEVLKQSFVRQGVSDAWIVPDYVTIRKREAPGEQQW